MTRRCVDCPPDARRRPVSRPGPRCATHQRERKARNRESAFARRLWSLYRLTVEKYWSIYKAQGGKCALCKRATGARKRLAVDHDHACCPTTPTCGKCTRGLCCGRCNSTLGHFRDEPAAFLRGHDYLINPPAREIVCGEASDGSHR